MAAPALKYQCENSTSLKAYERINEKVYMTLLGQFPDMNYVTMKPMEG
jgi:hypothetical protein